MSRRMRFRFDDISINDDLQLVQRMTDYLFDRFPDCEVIYGVSPLVWDMSKEAGKDKHRVYPKIINAQSDRRKHYAVQKAGIPEVDKRATLAGHGIVHQNHQLMHWQAQELSILVSCSLVGAKIFIPPFNQWNHDTQSICEANGIELIKFESGWRSMEHEPYNPSHKLWYLHARELTFEQFTNWFEK